MTSQITPFDFHGNEVRVLTDEQDEPWFVGKDICDVLGLGNITEALRALDDDEKTNFRNSEVAQNGGRAPLIVSESGFYKLVLRSRKPVAKEFQRWVTHEVLPSIRKHGGYVMGQERMSPEEMVLASIKFMQSVVDEQKRQLEEQAPKVVWADALTAGRKDILVGELAKILKQNGVNIGQNRLFAWLRDHGYLMKRNGIRNFPTQKAQDMGLFFVKSKPVQRNDGSTMTTYTTMVTPHGQMYFTNKFLNDKEVAA